MNENGNLDKRLKNLEKRKRFGYEQPPAGGRPPLSEEEKNERQMLKASSPKAARLLDKALESRNEKNAIRAAEIILSKTVPELTEGVMHDDRPLAALPESVLTEILSRAVSQTPSNGNGGNGTST